MRRGLLSSVLFITFIIKGFPQNKTPDSIASLPAVVVSSDNNIQSRVLSKMVIQTRGINNSQELLTMVPGLFIGQHAGGGKAEQIFLRGFDADHGTDVSISIDGVPVNMVSHAHGQGYADLHFVIPELIESIHFNKGPYYADKGDFATAGYAVLNTKNILPASMVKIEGGQFNSFRGVAMMNLLPVKLRKNEKSFYAAGEWMGTKGYFDHPQDFARVNLFSKYQSYLGLNNVLNVSASFFKSSWNASGQIPERAVEQGLISFYGAIDPSEGGETGRKSLNATLTTNFPAGGSMKNQMYVADYNFNLFSNFTFFKLDSVKGDQIRQKEKRVLSGYNGSLYFTHFIGNTKLNSEGGISLRSDITSGSGLFHTYNRNEIINTLMSGDIQQLNTSVYIKENVAISKRMNISAGLRVDHFDFRYNDDIESKKSRSGNNVVISPKLNIACQISKSIQLYLSTGKGFHSNDARVSAYKNARDVLPAVYGTDLGIIWKPGENLYINAALWYMKVNQELIYVGDEGIVEEGGRTRRIGVDFTARYQPTNKMLLDFDANYAHARSMDEPKGENYVPLSPILTSTGGLFYKANNNIGAGIRYKWITKRPANESYSIIAKGYFITESMVNYTGKVYELRLSASNILNTKWKETQFDTESRLRNELFAIPGIHFTPGTPLFIKASFTWYIRY